MFLLTALNSLSFKQKLVSLELGYLKCWCVSIRLPKYSKFVVSYLLSKIQENVVFFLVVISSRLPEDKSIKHFEFFVALQDKKIQN